jgi:hypothetical protein
MHATGAHAEVVPPAGGCTLVDGYLSFFSFLTPEHFQGEGGSVILTIQAFHGAGTYKLDTQTRVEYTFGVSWSGGLGDITVKTFGGGQATGLVRLVRGTTNIQPPKPTVDLLGSWSCSVIVLQ